MHFYHPTNFTNSAQFVAEIYIYICVLACSPIPVTDTQRMMMMIMISTYFLPCACVHHDVHTASLPGGEMPLGARPIRLN